MHLKDQKFDDIIHHARALDFWEQEYNQLSEHVFESRLQDLHFDGFRIFREQMNSRVAQRTKTPENTVNILIPIQLSSEKNALPTHTLSAHSATLMPTESDFFFCTPPNTDYLVISLQKSLLEEHLIGQDLEHIFATKFSCGVLLNRHISAQLVEKCTKILNRYECLTLLAQQEMQNTLRDDIIDLILHYFNQNQQMSSSHDLGRDHCSIIEYVYERVLASEENVSIINICQELNIPHRSLHYAFNKTTGLSPNKYIRAIRLNAADRMIHKGTNLITDVAYQYGFSHSSHFGREYKKLFGRIPSEVKPNYI